MGWSYLPSWSRGLVEPLQVLADKIEVDDPAIRVAELPRDRPWNRGPDADVVHTLHRTDAEAGRSQKCLVGVVRVVEVEVLLHSPHIESACEIDHGFAADAGKHVLLARGVQGSATDQEDIAAHTLGEIPVRVEKYGPRFGVASLHLEIRRDHVQIVVRLDARRKGFRRRADRKSTRLNSSHVAI